MNKVKVILLGFDKAGDKISKISDKTRFSSNNTSFDTTLSLDLSWLKKDAKTCSFPLYIIKFIFLDNIDTISLSKQLWNYLQSQYRKKSFTLWHNLFIYLMIAKLNKYLPIKKYHLNFKSILQKFYENKVFLPKNVQLAAFFYRIKEIYS